MNDFKTDFLIIGSGIAGLYYALCVAEKLPNKNITIVTKNSASESNTKYAQGGIAIVTDKEDAFEKHIKDTLVAGDGLCNKEIVQMVVKQGPKCLKKLLRWGIDFDFKSSGEFDLGLEGGHSMNRVLHYKDITGLQIEKSLLKRVEEYDNIKILSNNFAIDLITEKDLKNPFYSTQQTCLGAYVLDEESKKVNKYISTITMLATGGVGQVYSKTTNSQIATGDGIAMAYKVNAKVKDMEFVQFHPTVLYEEDSSSSFLISEALRGFGAKLRTADGNFFMYKYNAREELASRDIVSRAIVSELNLRGDKFVFLDCRSLDKNGLKEKFPNILKKCFELGLDVFKDMIPVVPAAHYICGGIAVNKWGQTSIKNLYACGECAQTGLHGANRLASNSLLEGAVFAEKCFLKSTSFFQSMSPDLCVNDWKENSIKKFSNPDFIQNTTDNVRTLMWENVGIIREEYQLGIVRRKILFIYRDIEDEMKKHAVNREIIELRNLVISALLIINHSLKRKINKGVFYNLDYA